MPVLIYCAGRNKRFSDIAQASGFQQGAQLPTTVYHRLYFADQNWKEPNRDAYMAALALHRPRMATVLDWEQAEQLPEVLDWAEETASYVQQVIIVPKVIGGVSQLPRQIGHAQVVLGYSIPTRFGGTCVPIWEFGSWPVHLLGGSPHAQMRCAHYLDVISVDGNMMNLMATRRAQFWVAGTARHAQNRWWPRLWEADGTRWGHDAPYEAFRRSCQNIMAEWRRLTGEDFSGSENEGR